jgi:hypothetical protein
MRRRTWDAKTTAVIVLDGLKGRSGAESCPAPQIRQALSGRNPDFQHRDPRGG